MELLIVFEGCFQHYAVTRLFCWNNEVSQDDSDTVIEFTLS